MAPVRGRSGSQDRDGYASTLVTTSSRATTTTVQSAQPWSGPSTTDLAAEMLRQMQAQGLVMSPPATASQHAVSPPSATSPSPVPSAQPALANVIAGMTGEREASASFTSLSMPVDLHIDVKLRANIQANGYVDLGGCCLAEVRQPSNTSCR